MKTIKHLLNTNEAAEYLRLKKQTLANWRHTRRGPNYIKMGRYVIYDREALDQFIEDNCIALN